MPVILDHKLERCSSIEMQFIASLAHVRSATWYFLDVSEECGFIIENQLELVCLLFQGKYLTIAVDEIDWKYLKQCSDEVRQRVEALATGGLRRHPYSRDIQQERGWTNRRSQSSLQNAP